MRLGLGLGITTPRGGDAVDRALSGFKHIYDARKGSAFTDYGTGGVNGVLAVPAASLPSHSGKWWTFNGTNQAVDLAASNTLDLNTTESATFVWVFRRTSADHVANAKWVWTAKDNAGGTNVGSRCTITSATSTITANAGDGTNQTNKTTTAPTIAKDSTLLVCVLRLTADMVFTVNGSTIGTTTRTPTGDASPVTTAPIRLGQNTPSASTNGWFDGDLGLWAHAARALSDAEVSTLTASLQAAWS